MKQIKEARRNGLKLIVIDPVRTQTAENADLFLQPLPGHDAAIFAAMLHIVLREGWHDAAFCADHVAGLDALRIAIAPFDAAMVEASAGLKPGQILQAAEMFARDGCRGCAGGGTGPNMAKDSNLAEHLIETLNVVCGRVVRAGEPVPRQPVLHPSRKIRAEVRPPRREWESGHKGTTGVGTMFGEMMTATLADEILAEGLGRLRALFCIGSNPANALPDQRHAVRALRSLDLLVTSDVLWSETAQLADIVFAVKQPFERPDHTHFLEGLGLELPFAQYTPALVNPPAESEVVDDWHVYFALAQRLGLELDLNGALDMSELPSSDALLERLCHSATVPLDQVKRYPSGAVFEQPPRHVLPAREGRDARLDVAPDDVLVEMATCLASLRFKPLSGAFLLVSRRERETMNSFGRDLTVTRRRFATNPAWMNPADISALGLVPGDKIKIAVKDDAVVTQALPDRAVRQGVISMSHGWGGLPSEVGGDDGASTARLVSRHEAIQTINAMPRVSGIPVKVTAAR